MSSSILSSCSRLLKEQLTMDRKFIEFCNRKFLLNEDRKLVVDLMDTEGSLEVDTEGNLGNTTQKVLQKDVPANLKNVDWVKLMDPNNGIPPDVCFKIMESPQTAINTENKVKGEVLAHKYLLAASSDLFRSWFFNNSNPLPISNIQSQQIEMIQLECSSLKAYKVMINYIYGKYPNLTGTDKICEMFEIAYLAERFAISGLEKEYRTAMFLYFRGRPK